MAQTPALFYQLGNFIDYTPDAAVAVGAVVLLGTSPLIAPAAIAAGTKGALACTGIWKVPQKAEVFTAGDAAYWDVDGDPYGGTALSGAATGTASAGYLLGRVVFTTAATDTYVYVQLTAIKITNTIAGSVTATDILGSDSSLGIDGKAGTTGAGGDVVIAGGAAATGGGGVLTFAGGAGAAGVGGAIGATGGAGNGAYAGGAFTVVGGAGGAAGAGGAVSMTGGAPASGNAVGGNSSIIAGRGSGNAVGGSVIVTGGAGGASGTGAGGPVTITGGGGGTSGTGAGGAIAIAAGAGLGGTANGGALTIYSGAPYSTGTAGDVTIDTGVQGSGTAGSLSIGATSAGAITLGRTAAAIAVAGRPTFALMPRLTPATVAAANSAQNNGGAVLEGFTLVSAADGTKAVVLPSAVAGMQVTLHNVVDNILKVFPAASDKINGGSANAVFNQTNLTLRTYIAYDGTDWYVSP